MDRCDYKTCENEATTKGFVLSRPVHGGGHSTVEVVACDKHKKKPGFFESPKGE